MAQFVNMPKEGITVESCLIGEWRKEIGDSVDVDDVLFEYETDKAAFECLSTEKGVLLHKFYQAGDEAPVLTPVAVIGEEGEDIEAMIEGSAEDEEEAEAEDVTEAPIEAEDEEEAEAEDVAEAPIEAEDEEEAETEDVTEAPIEAEDEEEAEAEDVTEAPIEAEDEEETKAEDEDEAEASVIASDSEAIPEEEEDAPINISPRAKSFAEEQGIDPALATPTGPGGRILEADVIAAYNEAADTEEEAEAEAEEEIASSPEAPRNDEEEAETEEEEAAEAEIQTEAVIASDSEAIPAQEEIASSPEAPRNDEDEAVVMYVDEQFSNIRTVIGKTMLASLQRAAQLTNHHSFDATNILMMREDFKTSGEETGYAAVSIGDIILYVTSRVLARHPEINALVAETGVRKYFTVNLAFACDTQRGLLVPVISDAEKKSLREISGEVKELAAAANEGRISPDKLSGGTFTVSNLGATGVEVFTPIINPPQAAIAGITGIVERARKGKGGRVEVYPSIGVSLTYDHRAIDGAPASRFAAELCDALADFSWKTLALELEK